ncbi:MAG: methylated-DNA--[protein]-cysteine S-methyltransferase [Clostridium sp.]|nr:methylated-DNA--[protein]-cysteine S-methyltransferase [Clostridium sp.]
MYCSYYESPIGKIKIEADEDSITGVYFCDEGSEGSENRAVIECKKQLEEYFNRKRKDFDLNIKFLKGTEFQLSVWKALSEIPYGEKVSYKYIAEKINNPKAVRAVGGANNKNPIAIIVPCHRVIGANGKMVGYAGGIDKKEFLLRLEEANK